MFTDLHLLQGCTKLRGLFLAHAQLTGGLEPLQGCTALRELYLSNNRLTVSAVSRKSSHSPAIPGLLTRGRVCIYLLNELQGGLEPLQDCKELHALDLTDNPLTGGLEALQV